MYSHYVWWKELQHILNVYFNVAKIIMTTTGAGGKHI
jgi:hypothetical protein